MASYFFPTPDSLSCKSNDDCTGNQICIQNKCGCSPGLVGDNCQFHNPCKKSTCRNEGKCVVNQEDGSYYCDCPIGYIYPDCEERDPCVLEGNRECKNGATCKRLNNFDYECKCRFPYSPPFCDSYNLCVIDPEECVEDLNIDSPTDLKCFPCEFDANCTQISRNQYSCSCEAGVNHSSCYFNTTNEADSSKVALPILAGPSYNYWNPIIPSIALTTCCLYFILIIVALILLRKRLKQRPRLIVAADIHKFDDLTYYLISVQTGSRWMASAKCNVACLLTGERGQAGPFPLSDQNLREVFVLRRGQEDNYLVSHTSDLGIIKKITIVCSCDAEEHSSSWYCDSVTVQNIKTEENWLFYASTQLRSGVPPEYYEFLSTSENRTPFTYAMDDRKYFRYQITTNHVYVAPFLYLAPEDLTLMFAEICTYMLLLIALYGFINSPDLILPGYVWNLGVLLWGSVAAICGFLIGLFYAIFFIVRIGWTKRSNGRIPTLLVARKDVRPSHLIPSYSPLFREEKAKEERTVYFPKSKRDFRIPATDIMKTEKWVFDTAKGTSGPEELADGHILVKSYNPFMETFNLPYAVLNYGFIGSLTDIRQQRPTTFVYETNQIGSHLHYAIDTDIAEAYESLQIPQPSPEDSFENLTKSTLSLAESIPQSIAESMEEKNPIRFTTGTGTIPIPTPTNRESEEVYAAGDFQRETEDEQISEMEAVCVVKHENLQVELCEMVDRTSTTRKSNITCWKTCLIIGWIICVGMIISATVVCCVYGGRYGRQRTFDWCLALVICLIENILVYQFLKLMALVLLFTILSKKQTNAEYEAEKIRKRFQVYYIDEETNKSEGVPITYPLKYIEYLPQVWAHIPPMAAKRLTETDKKATSNKSITLTTSQSQRE